MCLHSAGRRLPGRARRRGRVGGQRFFLEVVCVEFLSICGRRLLPMNRAGLSSKVEGRRQNVACFVIVCVATMFDVVQCQYGSPCISAANCTDPSAPHCTIFFTDATGGANTRSYTDDTPQPSNLDVRGICVECKTDCDCGINRYCGLGEWTIPATKSLNSGTAGAHTDAEYKTTMKSIELYGIAYLNMKIKSKCRDYVLPQGFCSVHYDTPSAQIVAQKKSDGSTVPILRVANSNLTISVARKDLRRCIRQIRMPWLFFRKEDAN
jgi:hypothetical protein